ncbi:MAG: HDOD domain-containing protein [Simplicispira sp.]|nr:HDOD domain-containing protein [Simplicispira sp.]
MSVSLLLILVAAAVVALVLWKLPRPADSTQSSLSPAPAPLPVPEQAAAPSSAPGVVPPHDDAPPTADALQPDSVPPAQGSAPGEGIPATETESPWLSARASSALAEPVPQVLGDFVWTLESALPQMHRGALMSVMGRIPRPPLSLQKLLSPDFLERANAAELSELVMGEPLIAAKVLSRVNAMFYGLPQPVNSLEPAVSLLGMDTVRNICLQYMLAQAFKPELTASQPSFDAIWRASTLATELALRLAKVLDFPDQGALATKVVMVFVGHLATASLLPHNAIDEWLVLDRLHRAQREQEVIGLSSGEIGAMMLRMWQLPPALVNDVWDTSRVLVTPASAVADARRVSRLGLAYLCVGLGERLALGQLASLADFDLWGYAGPESYYLRSYLTTPALADLPEALRAAPLDAAIQSMLGTGKRPVQ